MINKTVIALFFVFFGTLSVSAQDDDVLSVVDKMPEFKGGREAMVRYISGNIHYPESAIEQGISGKVYVKFVVDKKGNISNVSIFRGLEGCPECNEEVLRVVSEMPKWKPGKLNGKKVNCWFNMPIGFYVN